MRGQGVSTSSTSGVGTSHTRSAARYLQECLPDTDYWDVPVAEQTPEVSQARVLDFLARH